MAGIPHVNRTQALVLGFFAAAWIALVAMLATSAAVREATLQRIHVNASWAIVVFTLALLCLLMVLAAGVLNGSRWVFWLVLVAFAAGVARVPVAVLQLTGRMRPEGPDWYVATQGVIGVVQVLIAIAMYAGYRRSGPWGAF